ncbi:FAD synthetase [Alteribacter natronophilus]|uniref:FAD synthetase n=1 Tax=Alteribacter natronophilus TaxID=2583810 RepID=UPI00110E3630|nr:FAD synthetase [Alteribacter natronophilus]TMW70605.1 FAD synthetase [Alteribacter natronophilus]
MKVYGGSPDRTKGCMMAIGAFDGVHRGHQELIGKMVRSSRKHRIPSAVFTFDPPPKAFFRSVKVISPLEEKIRRIQSLGVDYVIVARFCEDYISRSAAQFLCDLSVFNPKEVHVGRDFRFGRNREGDVAMLNRQFSVCECRTIFCSRGTTISSTRIRGLLEAGKNQEAVSLLGWPV